ncbi:MAG: ABC transporter permease [Treponema sp.]
MSETLTQKEEEWTLILQPKRGLLDIPIKEIIEYRDLIRIFIRRDFVIKYKQTILGPAWYVINPLISSIIYTFVFGHLASLKTDGLPYILFYYTGTMLWGFFSGCFNDAVNLFSVNQGVFGKVYFPRLVVPISNVAGGLMKVTIQFLFLFIFYIYYLAIGVNITPSFYILFFPFILLWIALLANGIGMIISSITTKYRDLRILVDFALNIAMYGTAVVYPLSQIPEKYQWLSYINPLNAPIELCRICFYGVGYVSSWIICASILETFFFFFLGLIMFNQNERNFIDIF